MQLETGMSVCGFKLKRARYIKEQEATLYEFEHLKTGAELCYMDSDIDNKLFYAAFKTIPFDNTGVFHILEHSVLCGSELYPVREPFVELLKSSMQTFLNAITFSDKTVYPCSSRNEKDFLNLTRVYLDAVFAPRCIQDEKIFLQEGWRRESDENGECFKGVVFNEMKGAMASADSITERNLGTILFPDSCYGYNSGGDPKFIPTLSFEKFKETYTRFYHPSNCRFYLDGNIPLEKTLVLIDSYLSRFDKLRSLPTIEKKTPISRNGEVYYAINEDEEETGKSYFTLAKIYSGWEEKEKTAAMLILIEALSDSNSSPLKKAILDKGLGEDIDVDLETGTAQSVLSITVRNTEKDREDEIISAWGDAVSQLINEGIDRKEIEAEIYAFEFRLREPTEPRGLYRGITALDSWLYGGDPAMYLTYEDLLAELRNRLDRNGFNDLLYDLLPDSEGMCRMWTLPSRNKNKDDLKAETDLLTIKSEQETGEMRIMREEKLDELHYWQSTPDTQEQLNTLPSLSLTDIPSTLIAFPSRIVSYADPTVLEHKTITNGIIYANYYFKLTEIPVNKLAHLNFLTAILTEVSTKAHDDIRELQREIKTLTGNISFSVRTESKDGDTMHCTPYFSAKISTVPRHAEKAIALLCDILLHSDLSDEETIQRVLLQEKENVRQNIIMHGESAGIIEALSPCAAKYTVAASYSGYAYYKYLCTFSESFEATLREFREIVHSVQKHTFTVNRAFLSITFSDTLPPEMFFAGFEKGTPAQDTITPCMPISAYKGIKLPLSIGFATAAWYSGAIKPSTTGSLSVAAKILSLNTLWNKIRVSGGAYGAGLSARRDNCFVCYSFRDPTPLQSLSVFKELGTELLNWCDGDESLEKYIISTISDMDPLVGVASLAEIEDSRYLCGYSYEMREKARAEMLSATKNSIRKWGNTFTAFGEEMSTCLVGGEALVSEPGRTMYDL